MEKQKSHVRVAAPDVQEEPKDTQSKNLDELYKKLKTLSAFEAPADGVSLVKKSSGLQISIQSDELYRDGEVGVQETWYSALDQIANAVFPEIGTRFKVQILAYANSLNEREKSSIALTKSPYLFSASRAEWLLQYYESHFNLKLGKNYSVAGGGAIPNGKRVEILITDLE